MDPESEKKLQAYAAALRRSSNFKKVVKGSVKETPINIVGDAT